MVQVWPAVELAGMSSWSPRFNDLLPGWRIEVNGSDADCNSTMGPLAAFDMRCDTGMRERERERVEFFTALRKSGKLKRFYSGLPASCVPMQLAASSR